MTLEAEPEAGDYGGWNHSTSAQQRLGAVLGGTYLIKRHIGSGASSHVFEAEHLRLGKLFAVKLLRPELHPEQRAARRFRREARAFAKLSGEHIVSAVDCGELDDGTPYLAMELLKGEDLRSLLERERTLSLPRALGLLLDASRGVAAAHAADFVHRDLKPENLFVTKRSSGDDWCKVLDFGVAKSDESFGTMEGSLVGTVRYMSPEQLTPGATVGAASDVYALGAILFECLAGEPFVAGATAHETMFAILSDQRRSLGALRPELPRAIAELVDDCLSRSPERRPKSAADVVRRLQRVMMRPLSAGVGETLPEGEENAHSAQPSPRTKWAVAAASTLLGVLLLAAAAHSLPRLATESPVASSIAWVPSSPPTPGPASVRSRPEFETRTAVTAEHLPETPPQPVRARRIVARSYPAGGEAQAFGHFDPTNPYE